MSLKRAAHLSTYVYQVCCLMMLVEAVIACRRGWSGFNVVWLTLSCLNVGIAVLQVILNRAKKKGLAN